MKRLILVTGFAVVISLTSVLAEEPIANSVRQILPTTPLPRLANGHWYSRSVNLERRVIRYQDTYLSIQPTGEISSLLFMKQEESLPADYRPGEIEAGLPAAESGHWYTYHETEGERRVWDSQYVFDSYGIRQVQSRFLLAEPIAKKISIVEPTKEMPPEAKQAGPDGSEESVNIALAKPSKKKAKASPAKLLPPSALGKAPLVGESKSDLASVSQDLLLGDFAKQLEKTRKGPESLLSVIPAMASSVDWSEKATPLSSWERSTVLRLLKAIDSESSRWKFDLSKRFLTCADGKCLVRDRGEGNIEVPFQVGLGRIWLLSIEAERLGYAIEEGELEQREEQGQLLQFVRRLESLQAHLQYSHGESKSSYAKNIDEALEGLQEVTAKRNAGGDIENADWILRWQVLAKDAQAFVENAKKLAPLLPAEIRKVVGETSKQLKALLASAGDSPWKKSNEEQYELARLLYFDVTTPLRDGYRKLAHHADTLRDRPQDYMNMMVLMGASENLAVYGWTIMEELAEKNAK